MKESREKRLKMTDFDQVSYSSQMSFESKCKGSVMAIVNFLYTGEVNVIADTAVDLLAAANLYRLEELKSICESTLQQWVDKDNATYLLQVADLHAASILKVFCTNFILKQFDTISDVNTLAEWAKKKILLFAEALTHQTLCSSDHDSDEDDIQICSKQEEGEETKRMKNKEKESEERHLDCCLVKRYTLLKIDLEGEDCSWSCGHVVTDI